MQLYIVNLIQLLTVGVTTFQSLSKIMEIKRNSKQHLNSNTTDSWMSELANKYMITVKSKSNSFNETENSEQKTKGNLNDTGK